MAAKESSDVYVVDLPDWGRYRAAKSEADVKTRNKKTLHNIIIGVSVLMTLMILASIVFSADLTDMEDWWDDDDSDDRPGKCHNNECEVFCISIYDPEGPAAALNHLINSAEFQNSCPNNGSIILNIYDTVFSDSFLSPGWLDAPVSIQKLYIINSQVKSIHPKAFIGEQFTSMKSLLFDNNNLQFLVADGFMGLYSLEYLGILNNKHIYNIDNNTLSHVADTLQTLEVQYSLTDPQFVTKLIGDINFPQLRDILFSHNAISYLESSSFVGLVKPEKIIFDHCKLQKLPPEIFDLPAHNLKEINFINNHLTILPESMFQYISNYSDAAKIFLSGNPWHCDCGYEWFSEAVNNYSAILSNGTGLICRSPEKNAGKPLLEADFCSESTYSNNDFTASHHRLKKSVTS